MEIYKKEDKLMLFYGNKTRNSLEYRVAELLSVIRILRIHPELDEICFRVYSPGDDINLYRAALEEEAKKYGYNIYYKPGNYGTTLGMLEDVTSEYWE